MNAMPVRAAPRSRDLNVFYPLYYHLPLPRPKSRFKMGRWLGWGLGSLVVLVGIIDLGLHTFHAVSPVSLAQTVVLPDYARYQWSGFCRGAILKA